MLPRFTVGTKYVVIRSDIVKFLQLSGSSVSLSVDGIGGIKQETKPRALINTVLYNRHSDRKCDVQLVELLKICDPLYRPAVKKDLLQSKHFRDINLNQDYIKDEFVEVHVLIGLDFYWSLVTGRVRRAPHYPIAAETMFGWVLMFDSQNQSVIYDNQHTVTIR